MESAADSGPFVLRFEEGTVRLDDDSADDGRRRADGFDLVEALEFDEAAIEQELEFDSRSGTYRVPAYRYAALRVALDRAGIAFEDRVLDLDAIGSLASAYELRPYQERALVAWLETDRWSDRFDDRDPDRDRTDGLLPDRAPASVLELPTGSGKTVIALKAIERLAVPTLVVVPTIDLLEQWESELRREFGGHGRAVDSASSRRSTSSDPGRERAMVGDPERRRPTTDDPGRRRPTAADGVAIGRFGGGEQRLEPITVSTYDSAYLKADAVGDRFGLVVFDEVHHLGGEGYREIARLLAAPARLGLTATFERPDGAHEVVADVVGPATHRVDADELAGEHLAPYDVKRLEVTLTQAERDRYERNQKVFADYLARSNVEMRSGADYRKLVMRSGTDPAARAALLARQHAREIVNGSEAKIDALEGIFADHPDDRVIVFTAYNDLAYDVSERFLLPTITHRTGAAERREILERFRDGTYSRVVTSNVLDEGVDVPDASVAVILSGSGSEREFTQRLGRILRPKADGGRAVLYEVVSRETSEERVADRRR